MNSDQKQELHNEIQGMFRGLGSRGGRQRQWYNEQEDEQDKGSQQPTTERGQGAGATGIHGKHRPNSGSPTGRAPRGLHGGKY